LLFDACPEGVAVSVGGWLLYTNPRLEALLGSRTLVGSPTLSLYPEEDWPGVLLRMQKVAFTGRPSDPMRCRLRGAGCALLDLEVSALLLGYGERPLLIETLRVPADERALLPRAVAAGRRARRVEPKGSEVRVSAGLAEEARPAPAPDVLLSYALAEEPGQQRPGGRSPEQPAHRARHPQRRVVAR
jgi:hypothetical protein